MLSRAIGAALFLAICFVFLVSVTQQINLAAVDLGRHLVNGKTWWEGFLTSGSVSQEVLFKNFYSYTHPDFPFVNHHWGTGVVFHWIRESFGFDGLSIFYSVLNFVTFLLFFLLTYQEVRRNRETESPGLKTCIFALLVLPLISSRYEIRPEGFSFLFLGFFYWILLRWKYTHGLKSGGALIWILPGLMLLWVNLHIYFFLGFILIGAFLLDQGLKAWESRKEMGWDPKLKKLSWVLLACLGAALINPLGFQLAVFPFLIFKNYGYPVLENQSVVFFLKRPDVLITGMGSMLLLLGLIVLFLGQRLLGYFFLNRERREFPFPFKESLAELLVLGFAGGMGFSAIRNLSLFGYFAMPGMACLGMNSSFLMNRKNRAWGALTLLAFLSVFLFLRQSWNVRWTDFGLGLMPEVSGAAEFIQRVGVEGPIFNNYDLGGYLIYYLYPEKKVFVDNRPEAYPNEFFTQIYVPMQENESAWREQAERFGFNAIVFYWHDLTPWSQRFMIARLKDPDWAPVYRDAYSILWVKRAEQNRKIIETFEVDPRFFRIQSSESQSEG